MQLIPKIIHQIWSEEKKSLPGFFLSLSETWKENHPDWEYIYWNEKDMNDFMQKEYPHLCDFYYALPYDIQRWDTVRLLILYKMGGLYVDFDYECLKNIEPLLENRTCCIGLEPDKHKVLYETSVVLNVAFCATIPEAPFIKKALDKIFSDNTKRYSHTNRVFCTMNTTGPRMLSKLYESLSPEEKEWVYLVAAKYVTPFDGEQLALVKAGVQNEELESCLEEAYAVHYFTCSWV
jgi:mannosyltransferase OCH1-like enzyme